MERQTRLEGHVKGFLLVQRYLGDCTYECLCSPEEGGCGKTVQVKTGNLLAGRTKSCGCLKAALHVEAKTHGESANYHQKDKQKRATKEYAAWVYLKAEQAASLCREWAKSYQTFLEQVGRAPTKDHRIARIDPKLPYNQKNVEWRLIASRLLPKKKKRK